jgi:hypothetical protein
MAPPTTKTGKYADAFAYERIGLHFVTAKSDRLNFCDVHEYWLNMPDMLGTAYYTKPRGSYWDTTADGTAFRVKHMTYLHTGVVPKGADATAKDGGKLLRSLDLEVGGWAIFMHDKHKGTTDCWLFGPLKFTGNPYGSLIVAMQDYQRPEALFWVDSDGTKRRKLTFPTPKGVHFRPCTLWSCDYYSQDVGHYVQSGPPSKAWYKELTEARKKAIPLRLPDFARRVEWNVQASSAAESWEEVQHEHG